MPKIARELTALQVKNLKNPGLHAVGGVPGLLIKIGKQSASGVKPSRSWIYRGRVNDRRIQLGLGSCSSVSLAEARQLAREQRILIDKGRNPVEFRAEQKQEQARAREKRKSFKDCAEMYIKHRLKSLSNDKHKQQWRNTLETYVYPVIGDRPIADISINEIKNLLEQETQKRSGEKGSFWEVKTETASRVQGRIYDVFAFAITKEFRATANPAEWRGRLSTLLPPAAKIKEIKHHDALPYSKAPHFLAALLKRNSITRAALAFLLVTGVRSGSVRKAHWDEFDFDENVWTIPPAHEKTGNEHRVPLSTAALAILKSLKQLDGCNLVFPSSTGKVLTDGAISKTMRQMRERGEIDYKGVPHGCRATFRTWAAWVLILRWKQRMWSS